MTVVQVEEVTWPDGSLGCPQPGMAYTQALVPGYRVTTFAGGERVVWHTDTGQFGEPQVVTCAAAQKPMGATESESGVDAASPRALEAVVETLAARLGVDAESGDIDLVASTPLAGGALSCEAEELPRGSGFERPALMEYQLRSGDTVYVFRTNGGEVLFCREIEGVPAAGVSAVDGRLRWRAGRHGLGAVLGG